MSFTPSIRWNPRRHGTGIAFLDDQHRELFRRIDLLRTGLADGQSREAVLNMLDYLDLYVTEHFACEEREMIRRRCRTCTRNTSEHLQFAQELKRVSRVFSGGADLDSLSHQLDQLLVHWIDTHVAQVDVALREPAAGE